MDDESKYSLHQDPHGNEDSIVDALHLDALLAKLSAGDRMVMQGHLDGYDAEALGVSSDYLLYLVHTMACEAGAERPCDRCGVRKEAEQFAWRRWQRDHDVPCFSCESKSEKTEDTMASNWLAAYRRGEEWECVKCHASKPVLDFEFKSRTVCRACVVRSRQKCGTVAQYEKRGCRCEACVLAHTEKQRKEASRVAAKLAREEQAKLLRDEARKDRAVAKRGKERAFSRMASVVAAPAEKSALDGAIVVPLSGRLPPSQSRKQIRSRQR